jgi:hypothetical protein
MELWVDGKRISIENTICLQIYQTIDEGDDPLPIVIPILSGVRRRTTNENFLLHPDADEWDIIYEPITEPDTLPTDGVDLAPFFKSKIGGLDPWEKDKEGRRFIGQLHEMPLNLNFGGMMVSIYERNDGTIITELN